MAKIVDEYLRIIFLFGRLTNFTNWHLFIKNMDTQHIKDSKTKSSAMHFENFLSDIATKFWLLFGSLLWVPIVEQKWSCALYSTFEEWSIILNTEMYFWLYSVYLITLMTLEIFTLSKQNTTQKMAKNFSLLFTFQKKNYTQKLRNTIDIYARMNVLFWIRLY